MFKDKIPLTKILVSLESVLHIEIDGETPVKEIIDDAIRRIENERNITIDRDIFTLQNENQLVSDKLEPFLNNLHRALADLAFYRELSYFHKNICISLADVNYLGYDKDRMLNALKYFMDADEYARHADQNAEVLTNVLNNISICTVKRLFIVMLTLHRLGVSEGVACVAEFLYMGGLVA